jgi:hypothetical protein
MITYNIVKKLKIAKEIARNPEQFLINNYYNLKAPKGFRIELLTARKYNLICNKLKQFNLAHFKTTDSRLGKGKLIGMIPVRKIRETVSGYSLIRHPKKTFCPYCEKLVIPKRHHKLDFGDFVLFLFTAGLWTIFLFAMHLFIRRCPVCNYNLRGFKSLSQAKKER